jgi:two-component system chemotaxis response regulator CheY
MDIPSAESLKSGSANLFTKILVVEPRIDIREAICGALKSMFMDTQIITVGSTADAFDILASEYASVSYVITTFDREARYNTVTLLRQIVRNVELSHIKVSVLFGDQDAKFLPVLFDLGLLSCHRKPITQQSFAADLKRLNQTLSSAEGSATLIAADYLREILKDNRQYGELVKLDNRLVKLYPELISLIANLVKSYLALDDETGARRAMQLLASHPDFNFVSAECAHLEYLLQPKEANSRFAYTHGFRTLFIVDADSQARSLMEAIAAEIGFSSIQSYETAPAALLGMDATSPDLIVCDWRQRGLSGVSFLEKAMARLGKYVPVVLYSGQVKESDTLTLQDLNVAGVIEKPGGHKTVVAELLNFMVIESDAANQNVHRRRFYQAIKTGNRKGAREIRQELDSQVPGQEQYICQLEAELDYLSGDFEGAKEKAVQALIRGTYNLEMVHLFGKIYLQLGEMESAAMFFERANQFSAANIERLCMLSQARAELEDEEGAQELIDEARKIDSDNEMVAEAQLNLHLKQSKFKEAGEVMFQLGSLDRVISSMNNKAVVLARKGNFNNAMQIYDNALTSLPESMKREKAILLFNKSLALLRVGKMREAYGTLNQVSTLGYDRLSERSVFLKSQLKKAHRLGKVLNFSKVSQPKSKNPIERPWSIYASPGTLCLHGIYDCGLFQQAEVIRLLKNAANIVFHRADPELEPMIYTGTQAPKVGAG